MVKIIIPARYEKCYQFSSDGLAIIYEDKQHHFINLKVKNCPQSFLLQCEGGFFTF